MKKTLALIVALISIFSLASFDISSAKAASVQPRWNNTNSTTIVLGISDSGKATIAIDCMGISNKATKIVAKTKLERKWGLLWLDVDGAEWTDTTTKSYLSLSHSIQVSKKGTYRATTTFTVSGSGGANDSIKMQSKYVYE